MPGLLRRWRRAAPEPIPTPDGYARWAAVYPPRAHNAVMAAEASVVEPLVRSLQPSRALDVGTGTGRNLELLRAAGATIAVGVDLSAEMLARGTGMRVRGDARQLPFAAGSFDLVVSSLMCGDLVDPGQWLTEAARLLRPGGHLVYSDFHPLWSSAGWRRTFTGDDGRQYELPLHPHAIDAHVTALGRAGLLVRAIREPRVSSQPIPVVVVLHATSVSKDWQ